MDASQLDAIQPRYLRYRGHYRVYFMFMLSIVVLLAALWGFRLYLYGWNESLTQYPYEFAASFFYLACLPLCYFFWLRPRINHAVQVFQDHLLFHKGKEKEELLFANIESIALMGWSVFFFKMKNGHKYYFSSDLERVDYIWEGVYANRPELIAVEDYENFRVSLVKYDHHQKRKEWFFRHKLVDMVNWIVLPVFFMAIAWVVQSREIMIHQQSLYFFRLLMFSLLVLVATSIIYSMVLKKLIFDKRFKEKMDNEGLDKVRDLEFEGVVIQRSKMFQLMTSCFILALIIKGDVNFFSISKTNGDFSSFNIPRGKTIIVDNRYNCFNCRYGLADGDIVMFGKGVIGQVLAREGEPVGEVLEDTKGRTIASLNVQEVPKGHVAIKTTNGKKVAFIKIVDLIGKVKK